LSIPNDIDDELTPDKGDKTIRKFGGWCHLLPPKVALEGMILLSRSSERVAVAAILLLCFSFPSPAQQGVYVGRPKVFDSRTLNLMLEDLSAQLARVNAVDQAKILASMGALQGMETRESFVSGTLGLTKPFTKAKSDGTRTDETITDAKPAIPDLGAAPAILPTNLNFAMASQDILGDQVNLQYQIFNLRLIMDRSLSDRIQGRQSKLQAVLGIPISLDPSRQALDSAAIVKVTLTYKGKPVSLVALMPQEKTYNSATLSKSTKAFGASAVAKVVQVGFSAATRTQTYFMYRDNDTISFEKSTEGSMVFGWQFRPVLGRRSVAPGMRQMFAVVALPEPDEGSEEYLIDAKIETSWVKYQRSQLTTFPATLWYESLGPLIGKPSTPPASDNANTFQGIAVPTTDKFQELLAPRIKDIVWTPVGSKNTLIAVEGFNFLSDTKIIMGGKTFDSTNGLKIKSEKALDLMVDNAALSSAAIQGRYGIAIPLLKLTPAFQLRINKIEWPPPVDGFSTARIRIGYDEKGFTTADLPQTNGLRLEPQIFFNGVPIPGPYRFQDVRPKEEQSQVIVTFNVPADLAKKADGQLTFFYPFLGSVWSTSFDLRDKNKVYALARLKTADVFEKNAAGKVEKVDKQEWTYLAVTDKVGLLDQSPDLNAVLLNGQAIGLEKRGCGKCAATKPEDFKESFCWQDAYLAILRLKTADLGDELLLTRNEVMLRVAVPPKEKVPDPPKKNPEVNQYDSVWLTLDFAPGDVDSVKADGQALEKRGNEKKTDVLLTRSLTVKPGSVDLIVYAPPKEGKADATGKVVRVEIICKECQAKETRK